MSDYQLRCVLCGQTGEVRETDRGQLQMGKNNGVYVCPGCQAKIQYESNLKYKA